MASTQKLSYGRSSNCAALKIIGNKSIQIPEITKTKTGPMEPDYSDNKSPHTRRCIYDTYLKSLVNEEEKKKHPTSALYKVPESELDGYIVYKEYKFTIRDFLNRRRAFMGAIISTKELNNIDYMELSYNEIPYATYGYWVKGFGEYVEIKFDESEGPNKLGIGIYADITNWDTTDSMDKILVTISVYVWKTNHPDFRAPNYNWLAAENERIDQNVNNIKCTDTFKFLEREIKRLETSTNQNQTSSQSLTSSQTILSFLICPLSSSVYIDPVITPCGHSFSLPDLLQWFNGKSEKLCPMCRHNTKGIISPNIQLRQTLEFFGN